MQSFTDFNSGTLFEASARELDIMGIIKTFNGSAPVEIENDHIATTVPSSEQLDRILDALPEDVDVDVVVRDMRDSDFDGVPLSPYGDDGEEYEVREEDLDDMFMVYDLIIYTYNTDVEVALEDEGGSLEEVKRVVKINNKGKRRIKMQCKKGFKFDGRKCVKISGKELVNKRRAIRKSVRTKRAKGSGYTKRVVRLRQRANRKRKGMGYKR